MKRIVLFAVAGLVVGLAAGTGYAVMTTPAPASAALHPAADSLAADSLAHGVQRDSAAG